MKIVYTLLTWCLAFTASFAQQSLQQIPPAPASTISQPAGRTCGTEDATKLLMQRDPGYAERMNQIERQIQDYLRSQEGERNTGAMFITIPVVFHVVWNTPVQNVSTAMLMNQLDVLNKDFRRLNADTSSTPAPFLPLGRDTQIEFCLATIDPNGNPTTGITRTQTNINSFITYDAIKFDAQGGKDAWNTSQYMNFWVGNLGNSLLGYAQFPGGNPATDGIVCLYSTLPGDSSGSYNLGRTATHEVGHWLNLRHIWGDQNCGNDFVSDTPTHQSANYGCPSFPKVTCSNGPHGDMHMNYMDYSDDACMYMFTNGQGMRMRAAINTSRQGLLTSNACNTSTLGAFSNSPVCLGGTLQLTASMVTGATSYSWSGPNGFTSTQQNTGISSITAAAAGTYSAYALTNGAVTQTAVVSVGVSALPSAPAVSASSPICQGTILYFSATGTPGAAYSWTGPNNFTSLQQNPFIGNASPAATGTYSAFQQVNGCFSAAGTTSVTVYPRPSTPAATSNGPICAGADLHLSATGSAGASYSWAGPNSFSSTLQNPTIAGAGTATSGMYYAYQTLNGCTSFAGTTTPIVNAVPQPVISATTTTNGTQLLVQAGGTGTYTYLWSPAASLSSTTLPDPIATPTETTTYTVMVTSAAGCTGNASYTLVISSVAGQVKAGNMVQVMPNPTSGDLTAAIIAVVPEQAHISVTDLLGRVLSQQTAQLQAGSNNVDISISADKPAGIYILSVRVGSSTSHTRVVKQ